MYVYKHTYIQTYTSQLAKQLQPTRTLLVGMSHLFGDHTHVNNQLRHELAQELAHDSSTSSPPLDVQLAHDGLRLFIAL